MAEWIITTLYFIALWVLCLICTRYGRKQGFEEAELLNTDYMEKAGRVLFITKTMDVDTVVISDGERIITYIKAREI